MIFTTFTYIYFIHIYLYTDYSTYTHTYIYMSNPLVQKQNNTIFILPWHKYCFVLLTIWFILLIWCNTIILSKRKPISGDYIMWNYLIINYIIFYLCYKNFFIYKREKRNSKHFAHRFVPACFVTIFTFKFNNNIICIKIVCICVLYNILFIYTYYIFLFALL